MMKKIVAGIIVLSIPTIVMAEAGSWIETQKDSHLFVKKDEIVSDPDNADIKRVKISVNIPSIQERRANPAKTALTNAYPISYVTELFINCEEKTVKVGSQKIHENYFGEGKLLEEAEADPNATFSPLKGEDAMKIWEVSCSPVKPNK